MLAWIVAAYCWNIIFSVENFEIVCIAIALSVGLSDSKLLKIQSRKYRDILNLITFDSIDNFHLIWQMGSLCSSILLLEFNLIVNTHMLGVINSGSNKLDDCHVAFS